MAEPAKRFHYPPVEDYTGLVQFAIDRHETAQIRAGDRVYGTVRRGEVVKMKEALARRLVTRGGNFSHVAADTPIGLPSEPATPQPATEEAQPEASVPLLITAEMFANLIDRGLTEEEINAMTPQQAHERLSVPKE